MPRISIVYHSGQGHTQRMAEAVAEGAKGQLIRIEMDGSISDDAWATLAGATAIVFGSPTYMGSVSWQFKKFADASSKPWFGGAWKDKLFAGFTNSAAINGDKHSTLHYFITLAMQHGGIWVGTATMPSSSKAAKRDDINYLGSFAGAISQSPFDASPAEMFEGDLETATLFGKRIAEVATRWQP